MIAFARSVTDRHCSHTGRKTSLEIMEVLQRLNRERAITVVLITHEPDIAEYAERVIVFRDGRVVGDAAVSGRRDAAAERATLPPPEAEV